MKKEAALGLSRPRPVLSVRPGRRSPAGPATVVGQAPGDLLLLLVRHLHEPPFSGSRRFGRPDAPSSGGGLRHVQLHRGLLARDQLLDLMAAGVDVVLPIYWGDDSNLFWSQSGLRNLVTAEQALIGEGRTPPRIGMSYDTTALQYQNGHIPPDLTTSAGKSLFYGMIADFLSSSRVLSGRPSRAARSSSYTSPVCQPPTISRRSITPIQRFQADFGATPFIVRESSWQNVATAGVYTWGVALNGPGTWGEVGSLGPGYDESAVYGRPDPRIRARECGEFYKDGWEAMISADPAFVLLETWNEFHEGTDVAASREFGTAYITLTAENAARWKSLDVRRRSLVWLDLGEHPSREVCGRPLIQAMAIWAAATVGGHGAAHPVNTSMPPAYYLYLDVSRCVHPRGRERGLGDRGILRRRNRPLAARIRRCRSAYTAVAAVSLQSTGQWKRASFHLIDAYFGGRQNGGADLRLADGAWQDGQTNHFGRIWISKSASSDQPPSLASPHLVGANVGQTIDIPVRATDPDGQPMTLSLDAPRRSPRWSLPGATPPRCAWPRAEADVRGLRGFRRPGPGRRIRRFRPGRRRDGHRRHPGAAVQPDPASRGRRNDRSRGRNDHARRRRFGHGESRPSSEYSFSGWTGDVAADQRNANPLTFYVESDLSVKASFKKDSGGGGRRRQ